MRKFKKFIYVLIWVTLHTRYDDPLIHFGSGQVSICVHFGFITFQILFFDEFFDTFLCKQKNENKFKM